MLTIADKGGRGLKISTIKKIWIERTIGSDLIIHVNPSHVKCKLDPT